MSALLLILRQHDERVLHAVVLRRRSLLDRVMRSVTHLGDTTVVIGLTLVLWSGIMPGLKRAGAVAAFALTVSHLLVQLLKRTVIRPRPQLPVGYNSLIEAPDRFSFPSGHAAASLSLALPLAAVLPPPIASGVVGLAILTGFSRCYLGIHYPGDVLIGWLLAGAAVAAAPFFLL